MSQMNTDAKILHQITADGTQYIKKVVHWDYVREMAVSRGMLELSPGSYNKSKSYNSIKDNLRNTQACL